MSKLVAPFLVVVLIKASILSMITQVVNWFGGVPSFVQSAGDFLSSLTGISRGDCAGLVIAFCLVLLIQAIRVVVGSIAASYQC